ncbi:MAG TPA: ATP-binding cassette domain-containing protein [Kiritimatiellia bacterium]|nr:ATP-binding cassette domain-containing protein [Kiritimatiellia bacterium]
MIRFEHVEKRLGSKKVLDGVDFEIKKSEIFIIVGLSGAGKSVSLKHMVRLLTPDSGKVWVGDDVISEATGGDLERIRARFGYLFQSGALLQWMSAGENVGLPLREHTKKGDAEIDAVAMEKLRLVHLEEAYDKSPSDLSGGMKKRVALARAIVRDPEIVLYDEPTSGLDPLTSRNIDKLIRDTRDELGVTSIVVTHDLHSALSIGDTIAMLHEGRIVELCPPERFIKSSHPVVKSFLESQYITTRGEWERNAST